MLRTLRIRDLAIIDDLTVEFESGLNLLTGETGAGKSILVDALGLVTGDRADRSLVRSGCERAVVEALFDVPPASAAAAWAAAQGNAEWVEDGQVVIRRDVPAEGNGRVTVNGSPTTATALRGLGRRLLELHGQHEHQSLLSADEHLRVLDRLGGHAERLTRVTEAYAAVSVSREAREAFAARIAERRERADELERVVREIDSVEPQPGELEQLEGRQRLLRHAARMGEILDDLVGTAYEGEQSTAAVLSRLGRRAAEAAELDASLSELAQRLAAAALELEDVGAALRDYRERGDFDPSSLEEVEARRAALERLCLAFGPDEAAVLERRETALQELGELQEFDAETKRLAAEVAKHEEAYVEWALALGLARREAAGSVVTLVEEQLAQLALGKARLDIVFGPARGGFVERDGLEPLPLSPRGAERAEFLLAANPGEEPRAMQKVASGGELSRVMLALHAVDRGGADGRVLVFDEVDSGVGGAVADAVGSRLAGLARDSQVLCVTHLPQVAAYADRHYHVSKRVEAGRTQTDIRPLSTDERVDELARMLGGRSVTAASRRNASELLGTAGRARGKQPARRST